MKKLKNLNHKLTAVILSAALAFTPVMPETAAYAAEIENEAGDTGIMPEADTKVSSVEFVSDNGTKETEEIKETESIKETEAAKETENIKETETESVKETEANTQEPLSDAVNEESATQESSSDEPSSAEESESEEEMSQEDVRAAFDITAADVTAGGWNESIYAEISKVTDAGAITAVSWTGASSGQLGAEDLKYLVRVPRGGTGVRIDIPGLKAGTYELSITVNGTAVPVKKSGISVSAYDRSGFAHFKYTIGVGAYKDDGTLKSNAKVIYVTDENKNTVELTYGGKTVKGIGNILNSVGQAPAGGKPNTNQGIIKDLAAAGIPLVVRFIGTVSDSGLYKSAPFAASSPSLIEGLTAYNALDNGGSEGDNGHMARIQSGKDITLEGIGYDAVIDGWGFHYIAQTSDPNFGKSFEVRNLTFINTPEDAIGMEGQQAGKNDASDLTAVVERCWIHNNEFYCPNITAPAESDKGEGDGSVDFKRGMWFTCSYNYFEKCHKTNLVGSADYSLQFNLTYHHNYWYMCKARGPLTRNANVHMYNNLVDMQTDYAQNTRANAYIFSEYNLFYACKSPQAVEGGAIKSYKDSIASVIWNKGTKGTVVQDKTEYVPNECQFKARGIKYDKFDTNPAQSYIPANDYQLQTDFAELRKVIKAQTGVMEQKPKKADDVADSEYSVITRSGAAVENISSLPKEISGKTYSKTSYAFEVGTDFDLTVEYASGTKAVPGVLVNGEGENLLTGNGEIANLPAGKYMIQALEFQPGDPKKGTTAVFKGFTIASLKLAAHNPDAHFHQWQEDSGKKIEATCTADGKKFYNCTAEGCTQKTKEETIPMLGHAWPSKWTVDTPATADKSGKESRTCTRCNNREEREIPAGGTGGGSTGGNTGGSTADGDYVLDFTGGKPNGSTDFFTVADGRYKIGGDSVTVNEVQYTDSLKMETKTNLSFSCNEGAALFLAFDTANKRVKVDGTEKKTDAQGTLTVDNLTAGKHTVEKGDAMNLFYVSVANPAPDEVYYTLSFEYNYDDSPDPKTIEVLDGTSYAGLTDLARAATFIRQGYAFKGLYADAECKTAVTYPYVVSENKTFYAGWEKSVNDEDTEKIYTISYDADGGILPAGMPGTAKIGDIITLGSCTSPAGMNFVEWMLVKSGSVIKSPYTYTVNAADADANRTIVLKAVYQKEGQDPGSDNPSPTGKLKGIYIEFIGEAAEKIPSYPYTGTKITPAINVYDVIDDYAEPRILSPGIDYTVSYRYNVLPTTPDRPAEVIVTGRGNYAGRDAGKTFEITEAKTQTEWLSLKGARIDRIANQYYKNEAIYPDFTLKLGDKSAAKITYTYDKNDGKYKADGAAINADVAVSNNINKGTAVIYVAGAKDNKGNITYAKQTFRIMPVDISKGNDLQMSVTPGIYAAKGAAPASLVVKYKGITLNEGIDYTVRYSNNRRVTIPSKPAAVTITGKGNYAGRKTVNYSIGQLDMAELKVTAVNVYSGLEAGKVKATVLDKSGNALNASQYMLNIYKADGSKYSARDKIAEGAVTVEAAARDNNLKGKTPQSGFSVCNKSKISGLRAVLKRDINSRVITKEYTGDEIELTDKDFDVMIKVNGGYKTLIYETEYYIAGYLNNTNRGTATAIIQLKGEYSGTTTLKFRITQKAMKLKD